MARKPRTEPLVPVVEPEIIPDGDFAGMRITDVMEALCEEMERPLIEREVALPVVMPTLDMLVGRSLEVVRHGLGDAYAKEAAIKLCQTALPFALLEVEPPKTYASIAQSSRIIRKT
jgi:fructose-bisphosphate aldolase class 1